MTPDAATADSVLSVAKLSFSYGGVKAVETVSLEVPRGSIVGLIGPNGAGKSTLVDCVSGVLTDYTGSLRFNGIDITRWPVHRCASAGLVRTFQVSHLFPQLTTLSNLMMGAQHQDGEGLFSSWFRSWRPKQGQHVRRARTLLARYDLERLGDAYALELSGGQRRLTELARSTMSEPVVLLLDEPFAGVSPTMRDRLVEHLIALRRDQGVTLVMVEHRLELIEEICDFVYVMAAGKVIARGTMAELRQNQTVLDAYLGTAAG
jgi:ABC-type branched-subunit amino acid transport system ATPase component